MTIQEFLQGLNNVIKNGTRAITKAITKHGMFSGATLVAIAALATAVAVYKQQNEPLVVPDESAQTVSQQQAPVVQVPAIKTSITKNDPEWMSKYCKEQASALPPPSFKYQNKETYEQNKGVPVPPLVVSNRMPKNIKGYSPDSLTCGLTYKYDEKEAFPSVGVEYKFDINRFKDFYRNSERLQTISIDSTWEKMSPLEWEEVGGYPGATQGYPMLFKRENSDLGTIEYASMTFAVDYYVQFTVFEKPK